MPTLNIRNVPAGVVAGLKRRAATNGRSLNAEVVSALASSVEDDRRRGRVAKRLDELRARGPLLPDDAPRPEDVIREARDARAQEIESRTHRP
ncbi:MAG: Arc family DNA-binding protein [Actinobacteria bacterium]|nr:Arc family DNA-binding protein [Actinomycetota bacterium]